MNGLEILISNASGLPIYEQITTQIKQKILSGELAAGEALPLHPRAGEGLADQRYHDQAGV